MATYSRSTRLRKKLRTIRHRLQKQMRQAYRAYMETIIGFSSPIQRPDDSALSKKSFDHLSEVCRRTHQVFLPYAVKVKFTAQLRKRHLHFAM